MSEEWFLLQGEGSEEENNGNEQSNASNKKITANSMTRDILELNTAACEIHRDSEEMYSRGNNGNMDENRRKEIADRRNKLSQGMKRIIGVMQSPEYMKCFRMNNKDGDDDDDENEEGKGEKGTLRELYSRCMEGDNAVFHRIRDILVQSVTWEKEYMKKMEVKMRPRKMKA